MKKKKVNKPRSILRQVEIACLRMLLKGCIFCAICATSIRKDRKTWQIREEVLWLKFSKYTFSDFTLRRANRFNSWFCKRLKLKPCKVVIDNKLDCLGQHDKKLKKISLNIKRIMAPEPHLSDSSWFVLCHEIAHYRRWHHMPSFIVEEESVLNLFKEWVKE
jgi:hypothetical protein